MNSLFLRIYLSALTFLIAAFFIILYVANNLIFKELLIDSSAQLYQVVSKSLATKETKTWQKEITTYNALATDYTLSLVTSASLNEVEQQALAAKNTSGVISDNILGREDLYALYVLPNSKWILKIDEDDDSGNTLNNIADSIIAFLLLILPLAFALFLLVKKLTKPIQHLTHVAEDLGNGNLDARANNNLLPPMNTLANGFNTMANQLQETLKEQQVLVGAIPHELRSPLGRIRFALDMTRGNSTVEDYRNDIEKIDNYVDQMQTTVDEILELNKLQNQPISNPRKINLCSIIDIQIKQLKRESPSLKIITDCTKNQTILGDPALIKHAISNLISNAQRHTKTTIQMKVFSNNNHTILHIDDDGKGIEDKKLNDVFIPFSTHEKSRNREKSGIGLGLSIVKLIMKKHHGEVVARRSNLGGAQFELRWIQEEKK